MAYTLNASTPWRSTRRRRTPSMRGRMEGRVQEHGRRRELERGQRRPESHTGQALAIDPDTPDTLYAGTYSGVFKSTDGGGNWSPVNTGLTNTSVYDSGDRPGDAGHPLCRDVWRRVFKSTNGGVELERGQHRPDQSLRVQAWQSTRRRRPLSMPGQEAGACSRARTSGGSWSEVNDGLTNTEVFALAIDPETPDHPLCRDRGRRVSRARTAARAGARSTPV